MNLEKLSAGKLLPVFTLIILLLATVAISCHKRAPKTPAPVSKPQPAATESKDFELGEAGYAAGNYDAAALSYEAYLKSGAAKDQDKALFRLGLAYALQGETPPNLRQSQIALQQLMDQFPGSPYVPEAKLLMSLQGEIGRLADVLEAQQAEFNSLKSRRQAEIDGLKNTLKEQQAKIKSLTEELQRLRNIDMQRRPSRPSP
jgi:hypothetical protein